MSGECKCYLTDDGIAYSFDSGAYIEIKNDRLGDYLKLHVIMKDGTFIMGKDIKMSGNKYVHIIIYEGVQFTEYTDEYVCGAFAGCKCEECTSFPRFTVPLSEIDADAMVYFVDLWKNVSEIP